MSKEDKIISQFKTVFTIWRQQKPYLLLLVATLLINHYAILYHWMLIRNFWRDFYVYLLLVGPLLSVLSVLALMIFIAAADPQDDKTTATLSRKASLVSLPLMVNVLIIVYPPWRYLVMACTFSAFGLLFVSLFRKEIVIVLRRIFPRPKASLEIYENKNALVFELSGQLTKDQVLNLRNDVDFQIDTDHLNEIVLDIKKVTAMDKFGVLLIVHISTGFLILNKPSRVIGEVALNIDRHAALSEDGNQNEDPELVLEEVFDQNYLLRFLRV